MIHDMTMKERQLNKEQIRIAKEKNDGNESGDFIYVVQGLHIYSAGTSYTQCGGLHTWCRGLHIHSAGITVGKEDS